MSDETSFNNLLNLFPQRRVQPYDGMSITSKVWEAAHSYHYMAEQAHNLFFHGAGILAGLEVIASDPPDYLVYILPGVAVDTNGRVIVLTKPVAYDLGDEVEGALYLLISYRERSQSVAQDQDSAGEPAYTQNEFLITARSSLPDSPVIELARLQRESRTSKLQDAADPDHPQINELDLRFRLGMRLPIEQQLTAAVLYLGDGLADRNYGDGLTRFAKEVQHNSPYRLIVDDDMPFDPAILGYNLICLVGQGKISITKTQVKGLQSYLARGGTLLLEAFDEQARKAFQDLAKQISLQLSPLQIGHPLLERPFLFAAPPPGFQDEVEAQVHDQTQPGGFILTNANYGALWIGKSSADSNEPPPSREKIRAAKEWGINLLSYVVERRDLSAME